jgi:hypothetical protein
MHTTRTDSLSTSASLLPQPASLHQPHQPSPAARFSAIRLAWAAVAVSGLLSACGGGGGGDAGPGAPAPAPVLPPARPPATLTAEEDLAWKSYVLRTVGVRAVIDSDEFTRNVPYFSSGRFDFAGLYPAGTGAGTAGQSNMPGAQTTVGLCKDGGSISSAYDDKNKNGIFDLGEIFTTTETDCKDGSTTLNGIIRSEYQALTTFYATPNDKVINTTKVTFTDDELYTYVRTNFTFGQSLKGQVDVDITDPARVYRYKDYTYAVDGVTVISNLVLTIGRSTDVGAGTPFSLRSMAGSLSVDGITYQVSSSPDIPWKKTVGYLPTAGFITMTAANGDRLITEFTPNGAGCGIILATTTTPSLVVKNCSRR